MCTLTCQKYHTWGPTGLLRNSKTRHIMLSWKERLNRDKKTRSKAKLCKGSLKRKGGLHVSRIDSGLVEEFVKMNVYFLSGGGVVNHGSLVRRGAHAWAARHSRAVHRGLGHCTCVF